MPKSELRLIKHALEYVKQSEIKSVPRGARGIYVLYKRRGSPNADSNHYDLVYIGMAAKNIRNRIKTHIRYKGGLWTNFSCFEVWDNISDEEISELEGLFRHLYKYDSRANSLNKQKSYKKLILVKRRTKKEWKYNPEK